MSRALGCIFVALALLTATLDAEAKRAPRRTSKARAAKRNKAKAKAKKPNSDQSSNTAQEQDTAASDAPETDPLQTDASAEEPEWTPATALRTAQPKPELAAEDVDTEEEVNFDIEEAASEQKKADLMAAAGAGGGEDGSALGIKLFFDLLLDHSVGESTFQFRPNHTYAFIQANIYDDLQAMVHISDDPVFWELTWNVTPRFSLIAGKILVPFGVNDFHHIIGGRVDELSHFLPETWGDFGFGIKHLLYDGEDLTLEYQLYVVNGFSGVEGPNIADGTPADNNAAKGVGNRTQVTLFSKLKLSGSAYFDIWDADNKHPMLFYALGFELLPKAIDVPVLRHLRLRGEWARGEISLPEGNVQKGIINHAFARAGYFAEAQLGLARNLAIRFRAGRVNPDNRVTDDGDVEVYEPAILIGLGTKLWWTLAYQMTARPGFDYSRTDPPDLIYGKLFLMY